MSDRYFGIKDNIQDLLVAEMFPGNTLVEYQTPGKFNNIDLPFFITVSHVTDDTHIEIMKVTAVDDALHLLTVVRGQEGTSQAAQHHQFDRISLRVIKRHIQDLMDDAMMQISESSYTGTPVTNGNGQITEITVYTNSAQTTKLGKVTFTYADSLTRNPATAQRLIYKGDGSTIRRTENSTFTYTTDGRLQNQERIIIAS